MNTNVKFMRAREELIAELEKRLKVEAWLFEDTYYLGRPGRLLVIYGTGDEVRVAVYRKPRPSEGVARSSAPVRRRWSAGAAKTPYAGLMLNVYAPFLVLTKRSLARWCISMMQKELPDLVGTMESYRGRGVPTHYTEFQALFEKEGPRRPLEPA